MKASTFSTLSAIAFFFLMSFSANAQWQINGTNINNTNSGKVGIGLGNTGVPAYKLHVVGDRIRLGNNSSATAKTLDLRTDGTQLDIMAANAHLFIGSTTGNVILQSGGRKVGIGTGTPEAELHVAGTENNGSTTSTLKIANGTDAMLFDGNEIEGASGQSIHLQNHGAGNLYLVNGGGRVTIGGNLAGNNKLLVIGADNDGTASTVKLVSGTQTMLMDANEIDAMTDPLYLNHNSSQNVFLGTGGGNVRIGSAITPTSKLDVGGDIRCFNIFTNSDRRYKTGIRTLEGALDKVLAMRGTSYDFANGQIPADYTAGKQVGFIAQEMQTVMPELVKTDAEGMMSVNYVGVIPVLVEAMKEQNEVVEEKETRIAALERENKELKDRLARIEAALGIAAEAREAAPAALTAKVSPNPSAGLVTISLNNTTASQSVTVKVLDAAGREVANRSVNGESSVQFDLSQLPAGVYVAQVIADGKVASSAKVQLVK